MLRSIVGYLHDQKYEVEGGRGGGGVNILEIKELGDFRFKIPIKVGWARIAGRITWYFFRMFFFGGGDKLSPFTYMVS